LAITVWYNHSILYMEAVDELHAEVRPTPKHQQWTEVAEQAGTITDALGKPIDRGIFDAVVALNLLGFATVQSCEGHSEHGTRAPYIDIVPTDTDELHDQLDAMRVTHASELDDDNESDVHRDYDRLSHDIEQRTLEEQERVVSLLSSFYEHHRTSYLNMLTAATPVFGMLRIQSIGAELQRVAAPELSAARLRGFQDEMQAFTAFLKQTYFASESPAP
jgi:hypothetical protein